MRIKKLQSIIKKNGYKYHLVKRDEHKAIYAQHGDKIYAYEVFKTKLAKPHPKSENDCAMYDKVEIFPSDEEFGIRAWTYKTIEKANERYEGLS